MIATVNKIPITESMAKHQAKLRECLEKHGRSTQAELLGRMRLSLDTFQKVIRASQPWLYVVEKRLTKLRYTILVYDLKGPHILGSCAECGARNFSRRKSTRIICSDCRPSWLKKRKTELISETGVDPFVPATCRPGFPEKVAILEARYECGLPLWMEGDATYGTARMEIVEETVSEEEWEDDE